MNLNINGNFCLSANCSFKTVLFVDSQSDRYVNYSSSEMSGDDVIYDSLLENWTVGGSVKFSLEPWRRTQVKTGLNFRRDLMNKKPDVDERWYSHGNHTFTLFNEIAVLPWSGTSITAALGMHFFSSERFSEMAAHLSPMVSLSRTLPWRFRVYGSWANSVRYPTMHQLYSTASGNPALEPEEADKIEIGLEKTFFSRLPGRGEVRLAWFDNGLNNLIYRAARTYVYENIRDATLRGFEGSLTWFPAERFSVRAAYAVMDVGSSTEELLEDLPVERFSLELSGRTGFGTEVHFSFNRHLGIGTHIDSITLPDYDLFNLSISRKLSHGIRITLRANNLLDENYLEEPGYPGPGREILGGLSWTR
jgi:outer membrane cobalamin receptor